MPHLNSIENYDEIVMDVHPAIKRNNIPYKPQIDFFEGSLYLSHNIALCRAKELIAYWKLNNNVPDWIDTFQEKAVVEMLALFLRGKNFQLLAGTGTGKTYMMFSLLDIIMYYGYIEQLHKIENTVYPFPCIMLTPPSVVEQSNEVKKLFPNIVDKCIVTNYETLRTKKGLGNIWLETKVIKIKFGDEYIEEEYSEWREQFAPPILVCDENQKLKNAFTKQTKLVQAYFKLKEKRNVRSFFASASPFTKPVESKTTSLSLQCYLDNDLLISLFNAKDKEDLIHILDNLTTKEQQDIMFNRNIPLVNDNNFKHWMDEYICTAPKTNEFSYSPANMERITDWYSTQHQIVMVNDVKFKHKTMNKHVLLELKGEKRVKYSIAYKEYIEGLIEAGKEPPSSRLIQIWIQQTKFRKISEWLRCDDLATIAVESERKGKNVIIASSYVESQDELLRILTQDLNFPKEKIAIIRGGQSKKKRWEQINKFQDEGCTICLLMMMAGGVGLSLHHHKPRNKRPRFILMPPVWSIIDMLQILGRGHRINSESTTHQWVIWYKGTIEEDVCTRLKEKSLSMRELMRRKENWSELFVEESLRSKVSIKGELPSTDIELDNKDVNVEEDNDEDNGNGTDDSKDTFNVDLDIVSNNIEEEEEDLIITQ